MTESKGKNVAIIVPSISRRAYPLHLPHFPPPESGVAVESYPMASPTDKRYDEQLLAHAPEVTKADLQGGYNPDMLLPQQAPSGRVLSPDSDADPHDIESAGPTSQPKEKFHDHKPKSFWKTRKGIIIITSIIVLIVVILAAVLGGVLGSRKHGKGGDQAVGSAPDGGTTGNGQGQGGEGGQNQGTAPPPPSVDSTTNG